MTEPADSPDRDAGDQQPDALAADPMLRLLKGMRDAGLDVSVEGVMDALWLSQQTGLQLFLPTQGRPSGVAENRVDGAVRNSLKPGSPPPAAATDDASTESNPTASQNAKVPGDSNKKTEADGRIEKKEGDDRQGAYAISAKPEDRDTVRASLLRVPAGEALPGKLPLIRALRPLRKWYLNQNSLQFDEEATVEASARGGGVLIPVMRPERERWFECVVVADAAASMDVWQDTLIEFEKMARTTGVFRDVRRLRLSWKVGETGAIHPDPSRNNPAKDALLVGANGGATSGTSLARRSARRLILIATNGSGMHWTDGRMAALLKRWSKSCSVAVVQMLPRAMWGRTQMGEPTLLLRGLAAGTVTSQLDTQSQWWDDWEDEEAPQRRVPGAIPMWPLDASWMERWARMQMGGGQWVPGVVVTQREWSPQPAPLERTREQWEQAVRSFALHATPEAYRLAAYLSKGPFTLPVARLVQDAKFAAAASHTQLAEILLSGLVQRLTKADDPLPPEWVQYQFYPIPAEFLRAGLRQEDAEDIVRAVERRVQERWGHPLDIRALQYDPQGDRSIPKWAQPFVRLGAGLLGYRPHSVVPDDKPAVFISWAKPEWQADGETLAEHFTANGWHVLLTGRDEVPRRGVFLLLRDDPAPLKILNKDDLRARMNGLPALHVLPQGIAEVSDEWSGRGTRFLLSWRELGGPGGILVAAEEERTRTPLPRVHGAPPLDLEVGISQESLAMHNALADFKHLIVYSNDQFDGRRATADLAWSSIRSRFDGGVYWIQPGAPYPIAGGQLLIFDQPQEPVHIPGECSYVMLDPGLDAIPKQERYEVYEGLTSKLAATSEQRLAALQEWSVPGNVVGPWIHHGDSPHLAKFWRQLFETPLGRDVRGALLERLSSLSDVGDVVLTERFLLRIVAESLHGTFRRLAGLLTALGSRPPLWLLRRLKFQSLDAEEFLLPLGLARRSAGQLVAAEVLLDTYRNSTETGTWHGEILHAIREGRNPNWVLLARLDEYVRHNIAVHMAAANEIDAFLSLLENFPWWALRLSLDGAAGLESDISQPISEFLDTTGDLAKIRIFWNDSLSSSNLASAEEWAVRIAAVGFLPEVLRTSAAEYLAGQQRKAQAPEPEYFVLVAGSRPATGQDILRTSSWMANALGQALAERGWGLICGTQSGVDETVFRSFQSALAVTRPPRPVQGSVRILTFEPEVPFPVPSGVDVSLVQNQTVSSVEQADAVVLLGGATWIEEIYAEAIKQKKPVIPVPGTGEAAGRLFKQNPVASQDNRITGKLTSEQDASVVARAVLHTLQRLLNQGLDSEPVARVQRPSIDPKVRRQWAEYLDSKSDRKHLFDYQASMPRPSSEEILTLVTSPDKVERMIGFAAFRVGSEVEFRDPVVQAAILELTLDQHALEVARSIQRGANASEIRSGPPSSLTALYMALGVLNTACLYGLDLSDEAELGTLRALSSVLHEYIANFPRNTTRAVDARRRLDRLDVQLEIFQESLAIERLGLGLLEGNHPNETKGLEELWEKVARLGELDPPYGNLELKRCLKSSHFYQRIYAYCSLIMHPKAVLDDPLLECLEKVETTELGAYLGVRAAEIMRPRFTGPRSKAREARLQFIAAKLSDTARQILGAGMSQQRSLQGRGNLLGEVRAKNSSKKAIEPKAPAAKQAVPTRSSPAAKGRHKKAAAKAKQPTLKKKK